MSVYPSFATLGHMVRRTGQLHDRYFEEEFHGEVTARQYALMLALAGEEVSDQVTLSQMIAVDRSTVGDMVARLVRNGLILREQDPEDRRRSQLRLTADGERIIEALSPSIGRVTERLLTPLNEQEREQLVELLTRVATVEDPSFPEYRQRIQAILERDRAHT